MNRNKIVDFYVTKLFVVTTYSFNKIKLIK